MSDMNAWDYLDHIIGVHALHNGPLTAAIVKQYVKDARDKQVVEIEAMKVYVKINNRRDDYHRAERNKIIDDILTTIRPESEGSDATQ